MRQVDDSGQWDKLPELAPIAVGTGMAFLIAVLRALYESREPRFMRVLLEAFMCSGITVSAIAALFLAFPSLGQDIVKAVIVGGGCGAFAGFLGVYQIRRLILKFLNVKISEKQ